jgi:hypothetical protein
MTRRLKCRIDPEQSPYTSDLEHGVAGERQPVAAGR